MESKLFKYFSNIIALSDEETSAFAKTMYIRQYKKGNILLQEGQTSTETYFILEGTVRQYYLVDGEEKINNFFIEEQWMIPSNSFNRDTPSSHFLACCEDATLLISNNQSADDLHKRFPKLETLSRKIIEKVFAEQQEISGSYFTSTPEQRYKNLLKKRPDLLQKIPLYQLASYIGVKPESLSRIRKRISKNNA